MAETAVQVVVVALRRVTVQALEEQVIHLLQAQRREILEVMEYFNQLHHQLTPVVVAVGLVALEHLLPLVLVGAMGVMVRKAHLMLRHLAVLVQEDHQALVTLLVVAAVVPITQVLSKPQAQVVRVAAVQVEQVAHPQEMGRLVLLILAVVAVVVEA
jgi:hypothetical protein